MVMASVLTLFLGLIFQSFPVKAQEQEELHLYSQSAVLMDGLSGRILYGKMQNRSVPWPAPRRS